MSHPETIDRFAIVRQVGIGGMGTVYEAIDPQIDRRVAIKVLRREMLAQNPELIERLWVEARAANSIRHPGVVQISEAKLLSDGTGFLVMEFLDGQTLTQRLRQTKTRMPIASALQIAIQIASTLNAGHQKGIIHRDLKPDNVMLVPDDAVAGGERVKLLDFGIAKITNAAAASAPLTLNDMGLGTPGYMAPEQMRNAVAASDRSDVYGLGALLFELAAGRRAYTAPNAAELIVQVLSQDAPVLLDVCPEAPPELSALLTRMLRRDPPSDRPMMVEALRELVLIHSTVTAHAALRSGAVVALDPPAERTTTPPTIANLPSGSFREKAQEPGLASSQSSAGQPASPAPSASTISQMTGQSDVSLVPILRHPKAWLLIAAVCCVGIGSAVSWRWARGPLERPANHAEVTPTPTPKPDDFVPPPPQPPIPAPEPTQPSAPDPSVPNPSVPNPTAKNALSPISLTCVHAAGLTKNQRIGIVAAFNKVGIQLRATESFRLLRQGHSLEIDEDAVPGRFKETKKQALLRILGSQVGPVPSGLMEVVVQCGKH